MTRHGRPFEDTRLTTFLEKRILEMRPKKTQSEIAGEAGFVNPNMRKMFGTDSMPETGENVAADFNISREDQDLFAMRSQERTVKLVGRSAAIRKRRRLHAASVDVLR